MNNTTDGVFVSAELYNSLKDNFKSIGKIRIVDELEIKFLRNNNINCGLTIDELKSNIINNKNIWVDRMKDFSRIVNMKEIDVAIPQLMDLFNCILGQEYFDTIMKVMEAAFNAKINNYNNKSIEYDIFALQKDKEQSNGWTIVIFRIEAKYINNQWKFLGCSCGDNKLSIDFLGFHIRNINS